MIEVIMMNEKKIPYSFINEKDVMDRLGGNTALFNRLFGKYMNSYRGAAEEVKKLIDEKNILMRDYWFTQSREHPLI